MKEGRPVTVNLKKLKQRDRELLERLSEYCGPYIPKRPTTREDCKTVPRPCPFVGCKHNLFLDVSRDGKAIKFNFPQMEPGDMPSDRCCALDVAGRYPRTLEEVGGLMNLTRERVRQIEEAAFVEAYDDEELEILFND